MMSLGARRILARIDVSALTHAYLRANKGAITANKDALALTCSRDFPAWLGATNVAIAFSTYQAGKLLLLGVKADGKLSVFERSFARAMGIGVNSDGHSFALATQYSIQRFDNVSAGQPPVGEYDATFAPHAAWVTGDVDAHDLAFGPRGRPIFVNTLFSCLATVSDGHSFRPIWRPSFISKLAAEDRCHLNGMAVHDGNPRFVTAISRSDVAHGWRDSRGNGGVLVDVPSGEVVAEGLCMPHSPRLHLDRLWLLNSGAGDFGFLDLQTGRFEAVGFCPGYGRGLAFVDNHAIIGLSLGRGDQAFDELPLHAALQKRGFEPHCGLVVVRLDTGEIVHWVRIEGIVRELYDVAILPQTQRPSLVGFKTDDIRFVISIEH